MENPEPIVVIKRESTPTGQPPVVLITGVFIKDKRPIIVDERRDRSKELMVFDRRSTTTVSKEFSTPGFYPLDATHGPLMSLLAAVRLLDPVESQSSSKTTSAAGGGIQNNNSNNNQNSQFSYPMMFPQNNMYYGMAVRPGVPPIPPPANLPPQLLPVLQPYLFGQQQHHHHPIHNQQHHHHHHPIHSQQQQQQQQQHQHSSIPSQQNYHHPSSYTQRKPVRHAALAATTAGTSRSSPALTPGAGPTELRNSSMSPTNHRIRRKQPQYPSNSTSSTPENPASSSSRRVRFAKKDQVFSYDVEEEEEEHDTHHYGNHGNDIDDNEDSDQWEEYDDDDDDQDDDDHGSNDDQDDYYYDDPEEDIRRIRRPWTSPRMVAREQSHDAYSFASSRVPSRFPSTGSSNSRRRGKRHWPVVPRSTFHLRHTEV